MEQKIDKQFIATKAFIEYQGKILLLQESAKYEHGTNIGKWDLPGGRLEPGEHWQDALAREVREETGLHINIGKPFDIGEWYPVVNDEHWQVVGVYFACTTDSNQVVLSADHSHYDWFLPEEIIKLDNCAASVHKAAAAYIEHKK